MTLTAKPSGEMSSGDSESPRPHRGRTARHAAPSGRQGLGSHAAALGLMVLLVPLHRSWAAQLVLISLLLTVPGLTLLRALRVPGERVTSFPAYVPCASIAVLFVSGLAVDLVGPLLGVGAPLRSVPLLVGLEVVCLALLAASVNAPPDVGLEWHSLARPARLAWPLVLPLAAAAGALRLNSEHGSAVAVTALAGCVLAIAAALLYARRLSDALLAVILYATELATMWQFSLRGDLVYGFDIATEYYDLHRAVLTGVWHPGGAYNSMLSVTIMPAELHFLSGVPELLILKLVYPMIGALLPVAVFGLARRVLSRRWAFAAGAFIVCEATFAQELPAVARQEIALVIFAALVMAMLDGRLGRRAQWSLVAVLGLAMVLSHYSTTYVAIVVMGAALALQWLTSWVRQVPRTSGAVALAFVAVTAGAVIWYGPVTHSASGVGQLVQAVKSQGLNVLPNQDLKAGALSAYLQGNSQTAIPAAEYERLVTTALAAHPYILPLPAGTTSRYPLHDSAPPVPAIRWYAGYQALNLGSLLVQQLIYLFGAAGALFMAARRRASVLTRQIGLAGLGTFFLLALVRVSGTLAAAYNQERALIQAMGIISVTVCWCVQGLAGRWPRLRALLAGALVAALSVLFAYSSGLTGAVLGGKTATNLADSGEDFERFDMTSPELAAAQWLGHARTARQLVFADRYAQLPLVAMTGITHNLFDFVTPRTISAQAWIYADRTNVIDRRARALYQNHTVTYVFPAAFLDGNYYRVYTNGSSEVFYR